jgi:MinD superfamily P-loop ATPase
MQYNLPVFVRRPLKNIFIPKPIVDRDLCQVCGACAEVCPPHAISLSDRAVEIDYGACIRCYCCQEVCPEGAIRLQDGWVGRLFS